MIGGGGESFGSLACTLEELVPDAATKRCHHRPTVKVYWTRDSHTQTCVTSQMMNLATNHIDDVSIAHLPPPPQ